MTHKTKQTSGIKGAVLAAGLGTRLRPLTNHLPKPLVPLAGRPMIDYAFDHLGRLGIDHIGVNAFHLGSAVRTGTLHRDERISIVVEDELLGTGGGIKGIAQALECDTLVVVNGDALFDFDLQPVLDAHRSTGALGTLALRWVPPDAPFGRVGIDTDGRLWKIAEVLAHGIHPEELTFGAFTGVQIIERALIDRIPDGQCDILRSAYRAVLNENGPVFGHFVPRESVWFDVGTPDRYLEAHRMILDGHLSVAHLPPKKRNLCRIHETAVIADSAVVRGPCALMSNVHVGARTTIGSHVFIGEGAVVRPGLHLQNAVVWPGATVDRNVENEVILPA